MIGVPSGIGFDALLLRNSEPSGFYDVYLPMTAHAPHVFDAHCRDAARRIAHRAFERACADEAAFPAHDIEALRDAGLLSALLAPEHGGAGLLQPDRACLLADILHIVGWGSLVLGRLYEGHVNALKLVHMFGSDDQRRAAADRVCAGRLFAVWNTEPAVGGLRLVKAGKRYELQGCKTLASGAGFIRHPLVTARDEEGALRMLIADVEGGERADLSAWTPLGMAGSATGTLDFTGLTVSAAALIGGPDDFHRQPIFSAGAWRFAAVQAGGIERVFHIARRHLRDLRRHEDPHQLARMGQAAIAVETARLWAANAATIADDARVTPADRIAFVDMTRSAVERAGLDVIELAQRSIGLSGFMRGHPLERCVRDLATYLRQPAPDRALTEAAAILMGDDRSAAERWG